MPTALDDSSQQFEIELITPERGSRRFGVGPDGLLIGRLPDCDVSLPTRPVADRHAYVYSDAGRCFVKCLAPAATVTVGGKRVRDEGVPLADGDAIALGGVQLVFHVGWASEAAEVPVLEQTSTPLELGRSGLPLAIAALAFSVLACRYWAFGIGAAVLGWGSLREVRGQARPAARALARCAILMGLLCATLNVLHEGCTAEPLRKDAVSAIREGE